MTNKTILFTLLFFCSNLFAQPEVVFNDLGQKINYQQADVFISTPPLLEWIASKSSTLELDVDTEGHEKEFDFQTNDNPTLPDPVLQTDMGTRQFKTLTVNFDGQYGTAPPPDPTGAAGPNHYVQAVNRTFCVYSKTGVPYTPEIDFTTFFPMDSGYNNSGDPIVMYDRHADRYFLSFLQLYPNKLFIAISQTNDPTGSYYIYGFTFTDFPDFPKFSVWWDGYYFTSNIPGPNDQSTAVVERSKMLIGDPTAQLITMSVPGWNWMALPSDADGPLPPAYSPCYLFHILDDQVAGDQDMIVVSDFFVNWNQPQYSVILPSDSIAVAPFTVNYSQAYETVLQPNNELISALPHMPCIRAQHLRFYDHNSVILTQTIMADAGNSAVRWYELRDQNDGNWELHQQGTFNPDNSDRWFSSAAMDDQGNICLAYSYCDGPNGVFPGIRYTGRLASDPLNQMTFEEKICVEGLSSQENLNRYGDYSHMALDQNGKTFWFTGEYIGPNGDQRTRIFSTQIIDWYELGIDEVDVEMIINYHNDIIQIQLEQLGNDMVYVDLIDIQGKIILTEQAVPVQNSLNHQMITPSLPAGIYFIRVGNPNFQEVKRILIE
ncbi:MAG: T9SS type A sorting domain-containing protein [Crocinitomicaceae bacterium]|nr:T9SS type A sorting domain-containing protein [Crocinitomicaceae bacterium]